MMIGTSFKYHSNIEDKLRSWKISREEAAQSENMATVHVIFKYPNTENFIHIQPQERKAILQSTFQQQYASFKKDLNVKSVIINGNRKDPRIIEAKIPVKDLFALSQKEYVQNLVIKNMEGIQREERKQKKKKASFYAVKARFGLLVEGQTSGLQGYEERIVLIKAKNYQEAEDKALKILPEQEKPFLNSDKRYVWFKFEEVLNVREVYANDLNDFNSDGIEIYSEAKNRRMKPEKEWHLPYQKKE